MIVMLKLVLDCEPDAAWAAIRSPHVFAQVSVPLLGVRSLEPGGFPETWPPGSHRIAMTALGRPAGEQLLDVSYEERADVRIMTDAGRPLSGALAPITRWRHRMAAAPLPDGRTLFRDRLEFDAGALGPVYWAALWLFWQLRARKLRRLAASWSVRSPGTRR
jgi:hypothetical protein